MQEKNNIWEVKNLKKHFETSRGVLHAVDDVSFSIYEGDTLGVVGESGCGKSTLGRILLRLLPATGGQALFNGKDVLSAPSHEVKLLRCDMQMIFQDPYASLNPRMTVGEIIGEPMHRMKKFRKRPEIESRTLELMETVGLSHRYINSYPHELDGGRRQRIGIARALSVDPKFIVCDEPVSSLDVSIQAQILNLMSDLQDEFGFSYMFITHDLSVVKHISDEIMVMYLGQAVEKATAKELFANPMHYYTKGLLSAIPSIKNRGKQKQLIRGELVSPIDPKPGCRFANRCEAATDICANVTPELKEHTPDHFVACHNI